MAKPSVENVKSWLACNSQRWLLIIDNADDQEIDYSKYIPSGRRGDILLTTRIKECVEYETVGSETLDCLEIELARELLLRTLHITGSSWKDKEKAATIVVESLGSHTLAIIQAGVYMKKNRCSLENYSIIFQRQMKELLKFHSKQNMSTYCNVYATFEVSLKYIQNSEVSKNSDALNLLHTLAFMHNREISETIFQRASEYASEIMNDETDHDNEVLFLSKCHVARLPEYIQQGRSIIQDCLRWRKACAILESLSIITMDESNGFIIISMHSLIHAWANERQDHQTRCIAWQSAATILALSCKGKYEYFPVFISLQSHVRACVDNEIEDYTQNISDMEIAQILFQFAYVLHYMVDYNSLSSLVQRIRSRLGNRNEVNQEIIFQIKVFTARVFRWHGNFVEAIDVFKEIYKSRTKTLAEDHPDRLDSQLELASAYRDNRQIDEAIKLLEHVVKVREKLANDHPSRLDSQHELASAYIDNRQIDEAIKLLEHVVKVREKLANDHPDRLVSQHELARTYRYRDNGQSDEAMELLEHVVKIEEKLTEDHPNRLNSQHELARAYKKNGQIDEAIKMLEHVVKVREKLAKDHPDRLGSQHDLARAYKKNGQIDEAIKLLEHVVKIDEKLTEDHPHRLASMYELASAYRVNGQIDEAIKLLEHVVKIDEKLTEDHPSRLASQHELASAYKKNGQIDEAIKLLERVVKIREKLAEDNPYRLDSQHVLACAYRDNGQIGEAIKLLELVVKVKEKLAQDHPDRLHSMHELARAYGVNGQIDEAIKLLEHVVKIDEKLTEDHPNRLHSMHELARAYGVNGQIDEAIKLLEHVVKIDEKLTEDHPNRLASEHDLAMLLERTSKSARDKDKKKSDHDDNKKKKSSARSA